MSKKPERTFRWQRLDKTATKEFDNDVKLIIELAKSKYGIDCAGGFYDPWENNQAKMPNYQNNTLQINGSKAYDLEGQTFEILPYHLVRNENKALHRNAQSCDTKKKPYGIIVYAVLKLAKWYSLIEIKDTDWLIEEDDEKAKTLFQMITAERKQPK